MLVSYEDFVRRADAIRARIAEACAACGRSPDDVALLPVTKSHPVDAVEYVARYGLGAVGENRVQEGIEKRGQAKAAVRWELIGHLQTNKARLAVRHFDRIQSVDSVKLLDHLERAAAEQGRILPMLLQINAGNDPAKFGADPADGPRLLEAALEKKHLAAEGLMTIAPLGASAAETAAFAERTFANLRQLRDRLSAQSGLPLKELSMGMSGDFPLAIAAGSTLVRIGSALFGEREIR